MNQILVSPTDYNLPHDEWRPGQREAVEWVNSQTGNLIMSAKTGAGKTSVAKSLAMRGKTVALVRNKSLQVVNYGEKYGYDILMGKNNYSCLRGDGLSCQQCLYAGKMNTCPSVRSCPYLIAKRKAVKSDAASTNYAYWLTTETFKNRGNYALVMDEAHLLPSIVLDYVGIIVTEEEQQKYDLPEFPMIEFESLEQKYLVEASRKRAISWLQRCKIRLARITDSGQLKLDLKFDEEDESDEDEKLHRFKERINSVLYSLQDTRQVWYIRSGDYVVFKEGEMLAGFEARPLTARYHFSKNFLGFAEVNLLMSATIGNPETFAGELGIKEWQFLEVMSPYPPSERPIIDLGCPALSYYSTDKEYMEQARRIAGAIKGVDTSWCGIIHTTSKIEARNLAARLRKLGLANRVYVPRADMNTSETLLAWEKHKRRHSNAICIAWNMGEGVDLLEEKICIAAKVPYASLGNPYEKMRMEFAPMFYKLRAAWDLIQALGRTRRGRPEDYGAENGLVAIADGSWTMLKNFIDKDILDSIVSA